MTGKIFDDRSGPSVDPEDRETIAEKWLEAADQLHGGPVDVMRLLETADIALVPWSLDKMGDNEFLAKRQVRTIFGRPDAIQSAREGKSEAVLKVFHEFGHCVLHNGSQPKPLKINGNKVLPWINETSSEERQAWDLGRAFAMPRKFIREFDSAQAVAARFSVPIQHAELRLATLRLERHKKLQNDTRFVGVILPDHAARVWNNAAIDSDHPSDLYRLSNKGFLVAITGFQRLDHPLGWYIYCGKIYWKDEWDHW